MLNAGDVYNSVWERNHLFKKKKKSLLYRTINRIGGFSDTFCTVVCFFSFSVWVICFMGGLWAACPGIPWKMGWGGGGACVSCLHWFPKWEAGLACWMSLVPPRWLESSVFICFPFGWCKIGRERRVCRYQLSPSRVPVVWRGNWQELSQGSISLCCCWGWQDRGYLNFLSLSTPPHPPFRAPALSAGIPLHLGRDGKDENKHLCAYSDSIMLSLSAWKNGSWISGLQSEGITQTHSNKSNWGISLCVCQLVPF